MPELFEKNFETVSNLFILIKIIYRLQISLLDEINIILKKWIGHGMDFSNFSK